jgi:hypothetical protein
MLGAVGVGLMAVAAVAMYQSGYDTQQSMILAAGPVGAGVIIAFLASS